MKRHPAAAECCGTRVIDSLGSKCRVWGVDRTRDCCLDKMPSFQCSVSVIARIICVWNISITNEFELKVLTAGLVLKIQSSVSSPV